MSCSGRNTDNKDIPKFNDPKYYNNPQQCDEFLRYVFASYPSAASITSSQPFHHFKRHCQVANIVSFQPAAPPSSKPILLTVLAAKTTFQFSADIVDLLIQHANIYTYTLTDQASIHILNMML